MRAMQAPISRFANKKRVVSKWHGFFICKKCTLYVKYIDIIRIMSIYNHRKEINKSERW